LHNIKTIWINMVVPSKVVLEELKIFWWRWHKMLIINFVATNYKLICDIETIFGLICVMFMLETLQGLIKYV
jgi:hypothetical protein